MKPGPKTLVTVLLLAVGLVLVNYLASVLPARLDATAERVYTLSPGTKAILGRIGEPVTLDLYYSRDTAGQAVEYANYAERVREMLRQYVRASHGKVILNVIDPEPDTPEEEKATTAGIEPQTVRGTGNQFYFGLVATQADQQKALPSLTPEREQFLEYDVSELVASVQLADKKKLGLITSLPLLASSAGLSLPGQDGGGGQPGQFVASEWAETFQIVPVEAGAAALPPGLDALAIVHPENLTPGLQFSIDQFLLAGRPVFLAVDPSSQYFKQLGGQSAMMEGPPTNLSSDLPVLLGGWGIAYDPNKVVGDLDNAQQVQLTDGGAPVSYPVWLNLTADNFNQRALPTGQLSSALFIEGGSVALKPGSSLTFTPLVETSAHSGEIASSALEFAQPEDVTRQIVPTGKRTLAALITGKFPTAFPAGAPKAAGGGPAASPASPGLLKASAGSSTLFLVADTDWLLDAYSVNTMTLGSQTVAEPKNDNLALASNALDFLAGSQDLISIRSKGDSLRPFTVVRRMEADAEEKYSQRLTELEGRLNDIESKLSELQGKKTEGNRLIEPPEVTRAIEDFQRQESTLRAERRRIRLSLREGIDALENELLVANLLAGPLLVVGFGLWFRRRRRAA